MKNALYALLSLFIVWMAPTTCFGQPSDSVDVAAGSRGRIVSLGQGTRAPFSGMLIEERDLVKWRLKIEHLDLQLKLHKDFTGKVGKIRENLCAEKVQIHKKLDAEKTKLWTERTKELAGELQSTRSQLVKAQRPRFWKSPVLWFSVGLVLGTVVILVPVFGAK